MYFNSSLWKQNGKICKAVGNHPVYCCINIVWGWTGKPALSLVSKINKSIVPNTEQLFFINPTRSCCNGSLHNPVTAFGFLLFLGGSTDPFGGFADFSSAAASASFPSSQGRFNLQIGFWFKGRKRQRDTTWYYWKSLPFSEQTVFM